MQSPLCSATPNKRLPQPGEILRREFTINLAGDAGQSWAAAIDQDKRTVVLAFSSEAPVERWFGLEVLDHQQGSIRLQRIQEAGPLLMDHNHTDLIGKVEEIAIGEDLKGRAVVRFGRSARADEIFQDVMDGIRTTISVGYLVHEMVLESESKDGPATYRVTDWEPIEISFVSIPADISAQVGRSAPLPSKETLEMESSQKIEHLQAQNRDLQRIADIRTIGDKAAHLFDPTDLVRQFIDSGRSASEFQAAVIARMDQVHEPAATMPSPDDANIGLSRRETGRYSISRLLAAQLSGDWSRAGLEREASQAVAIKLGKQPNGSFVPYDVLAHRDLTSTAGVGADLIGTDHQAGSFIELMRNESIVARMGCTMLPGLTESISIPRQDTANSGTWIDNEDYSGSAETNATFSAVSLTPKTLRLRTDITRKMLKQASPVVDMIIKADLAAVAGEMIDAAAIVGAGTGNQPQGIRGATGVATFNIAADGGALTWDHLVDMETALLNYVRAGNLAYLTNSLVIGAMKKIPRHATASVGGYLLEDGKANGHPVHVSNSCPSNLTQGSGTNLSLMIFGAWKSLLVGMWGGLDVLADPHNDDGRLILRAFQDVDIALRYPGAFCVVDDIAT